MIGHVIREFLPAAELLNYFDAILRVYNRYGRRDNKYKARIKILVKEIDARRVHAAGRGRMGSACAAARARFRAEEIARLAAHFVDPAYREFARDSVALPRRARRQPPVRRAGPSATCARTSARATRSSTLSLKRTGTPPGDATASEMDAIAALADRYSFGEVRVTHEQNLVFADVLQIGPPRAVDEAQGAGLATPNIGLLTDIVCCPGGDFCSLANAKSIPIAEAIQRRFDDLDYLYDLGDLELNMSGCMNACGHHHVGHIGILGVDKNGDEWYQVSLGGAQGNDASLGKVIGPSFAAADVPDVIVRIVDVYVENRGTTTSASSTPCAASASSRSRSASMPQLIKDRARRRRSLGRCCATRPRLPTCPTACRRSSRSRCGRRERAALLARGDVGVWLAPTDDPGGASRTTSLRCR